MSDKDKSLNKYGIQAIVFVLAILAFVWPFIASSVYSGIHGQFKHLFIVWGLLIALLFILSRSHTDNNHPPGA